MPNIADLEVKHKIESGIKDFCRGTLLESVSRLLDTLGYRSSKLLPLEPNTLQGFLQQFDADGKFDIVKALGAEWKTIDFVFQLTSDELSSTVNLFDAGTMDSRIIESYLFFAIELEGDEYSRTKLSQVTREVNKLTPIPSFVFFKYGRFLTLAVIDRRLHRRDETKDILEKVTLIKDINTDKPHRAHIEILYDLCLPELLRLYQVASWVELHDAWRRTLNTSELSRKFYREIANWYFWAVKNVVFPDDAEKNDEIRNATNVIRMITRLIFVWFLKEKGLVPDDLFTLGILKKILRFSDKNQSTYYKAILQNLFFATLNTEMDKRKFRGNAKEDGGRDQHYMIHNVFRYEQYFIDPQGTLKRYFAGIPFLNGGLFECLDKVVQQNGKERVVRVDAFTDRRDNDLKVPDELLFGDERTIDLSVMYGDERRRRERVRGLVNILRDYKFTVDENTPIEEEIALDPELLGRVFENLLASYNPETRTTARKATGSYYTPREIVNYMVDESLTAYLVTYLTHHLCDPASGLGRDTVVQDGHDIEIRLSHLLSYTAEENKFSALELQLLLDAIYNIKILDPACGSGAFPMGMLQKLVYILSKLDPKNDMWKQKQIEKVMEVPDPVQREKMISDVEQAFQNNELDYGRKLYLIGSCIYGVDIQSIAVQIAKLRFFISLIVDQLFDPNKENIGIRPLPNLETKFVAANTLVGIPKQASLRNLQTDALEEELRQVRKHHFTARTQATKEKYRLQDSHLRSELTGLLMKDGFPAEVTERLASWNPYDQNVSADFFDPEWMFGIKNGFDVLIGNPPYVRVDDIDSEAKREYKAQFDTAVGKYDLYYLFFDKAQQLLNDRGTLTFIHPNKFTAADSARKLRKKLLDRFSGVQIVSTSMLGVFESVANYPLVTQFYGSEKNVFLSVLQAEEVQADRLAFGKVSYALSKESASILPDAVIPINVDQSAVDIILRLVSSCVALENFVSFSEGLRIPAKYETEESSDFKIVKQFQFERYSKIRRASFVPRKRLMNILSESSSRYRSLMRPKILIAEDGLQINATLDEERYVPQGGVYFSSVKRSEIDLLFVLGLLNSKLLSFIYSGLFAGMHMGGGYLRFRSNFLEKLPFPRSAMQEELITKCIVGLVNLVLKTKNDDPDTDTSALENEIDIRVFKIYELTYDEVKIVDPEFGMEKDKYENLKMV